MKNIFICYILYIVIPSVILAQVPACKKHGAEFREIRTTAIEYLEEAHRLTGDAIGSVVVTSYDVAENLVQLHKSYTDYSSTYLRLINNCNRKGKFLASNHMYIGLDKISDMFLNLYSNCIINHQNHQSLYERGKIHYDKGNYESCLIDISNLISANCADDLVDNIKSIDLLITKAQALLETGEYDKALLSLSEAIKKNPQNKEAYFLRAIAFFETGDFENALQNYVNSKNNKANAKPTYIASPEFYKALIKSLSIGIVEASSEIIPSLCNTAYGLGETLWVTAQHPIESAQDFANVCYEMGEGFVSYCKNVDWDTVDNHVDQLKTLYEKFDQLNDTEKGELLGYTIGKYGVDMLAGGTTLKGMSAFRSLKKANRICNFETMLVSNSSKNAVINSSLKHAAQRENYLKNVKIYWDKQNKHILGKHNFEAGKGTILIEHYELENLVKAHVGKGQIVKGKLGEVGFKERVDFGKIIGEHALKIEGQPTIYQPTSKGIISYAKDGTVHVYPSNPNATYK